MDNNGTLAPPAPAALDVGRVVGLGFKLYFKNFAAFTLLTLLVTSPNIIWTILVMKDLTLEQLMDPENGMQTFNIGSMLLGLVLQPIATAAIMFGVFESMKTGRAADIGASVSVGLRKLLPVLLVSLATGLSIGLGMLALIVPGVVLAIALSVAVPAAVADDKLGVVGAMRYSFDLTQGQRWRILGILGIFVGITIGLSIVASIILMIVYGINLSVEMMRTNLFVSLAIGIMMAALQSVVFAVLYHDLRVLKEGIPADELARIFD